MTANKREEILTKAKQILFSTEMVSAILDGRKATTRRVLKPHNSARAKRSGFYQGNGLWCDKDIAYIKDYSVSCCWIETKTYIKEYAPYKVGDILYVRETWAINNITPHDPDFVYKVDYDCAIKPYCNWKWKPSINMPKEAARIFLRVTDVRVERLQDITEEQATAEGFVFDTDLNFGTGASARRHFFEHWDNTIKKSDLDKYGWDANPWVWVIEFERISREEAEK